MTKTIRALAALLLAVPISLYGQATGGGGVPGGGGASGNLPTASAAGQVPTATGAGTTYTAQADAPSSSIFYIASNCRGLTNCVAWVDDDSTDNCGTATTAFMSAINSSTASTPYVYIQGGGSGKAYKLTSCNLAFTGPSGTGGLVGSPTIISNATIDCAQTGGNCIQMGKTGCSTSSFYGTGCHDVTWRGGTFIGGVGLGTAVMEVEQGMYINVIDDVTFQNTGAGNATLGTCTNYSVQWDTFIGGQEFSRNKYWGNVLGQCFSKNVDATGGANTIVFTNNVISHDTLSSNCGGILHSDSSQHSIISGNTLFGFGVDLLLIKSATATQEGGWVVTDNNLDTAGCTISGGQPAAVQFGFPSNNGAVGPVTFNNNNGYTTPLIAQYPGSSATMQGWSITGNNTTWNATTSYLIGGSSTSCSTYNSIPCYIGANPGYGTGGSGGAYTGFTVLGAASNSTWPPTTASPTFSPAAGSISGGTTVTTSCSGGSPYISTGSTAVAGATGIAVSAPETLYGSCQGSGYFSTGSAAYTIASFAVTNNGYFHGSSSSVTSQALTTFGSALTNGSLIVVHQYSTTATYTVPTDTAGNTYVDCGPGIVAWGTNALDAECFYALNTHSTASNVVTLHSSSAQFLSGMAFEITGAASSSPIDGGSGVGYSIKANAGGGAAGSNALTATSLTPAGNGDLIVAFFPSSSGSGAGTSPNAFTLVNAGWIQSSEYFTQSTSAAITATASDSTSTDPFAAIVIAIKP